MSELMLDVGLANELKLALREARGSDGSEWTAGDVKSLANPAILGQVLDLVCRRAEIVIKKVEEVVVQTLALVRVIAAPAVAGKKTRDCFRDKSIFWDPDPDLVVWLPETQPDQTGSGYSIYQLDQNATFKRAVESFLGVGESDIKILSRLLRERGHTTTLPAFEKLIKKQEAGEDVGLRTDAGANFSFVEEKAEEGEEPGVSVVGVGRHGRRWYVGLGRLGHDYVWLAGYRFFFRNKTL